MVDVSIEIKQAADSLSALKPLLLAPARQANRAHRKIALQLWV